MADKELRPKSDRQAIDQFINEVRTLPKQGGGQASLICGKLKVAGESCMVVN